MSVGAALGAPDAEALISLADSAMYRAKREGVGVSLADGEESATAA